MKKAVSGILLALIILGTAAGLSGREMANDQLEAIKSRWAELQSQSPYQREAAEVAALQEQAEGLANQFPGREEIRIWERIIERSSQKWTRYRGHTG